MTEEPFDLRARFAPLRRHWLAVVVMVTLAAAAGLVGAAVQQPTYLARASVVLPPAGADARGNPVRNIEAEARLAGTGDVLSRAGAALQPPLGPGTVRSRVSVTTATDDVLDVRARAASADEAVRLANAVAEAYVAVRTDATAGATAASVAELRSRAGQLEERIARLEQEIGGASAGLSGLQPGSPEALRQAATVDSLKARAAEAGRELADVNGKVAAAKLEADLEIQGTRVVDAAAAAPAEPRPLRLAGLGALAGLVAGIVLAYVLERGGGRPRRRDEIAAAVGAPVLASLSTPGGAERAPAGQPEAEPAPPDDAETEQVRRALEQLGVTGRDLAQLVVIVLPGDRKAALVAVRVAGLVRPDGGPASLTIWGRHPTAAVMREAAAAVRGRTLLVPSGQHRPELRPAVSLLVPDGGLEIPDCGRDGATVVTLAVSAGKVATDLLTATARECHQAGHPLQGVFVAEPDPGDRTSGALHPPLPAPDAGEPATSGATGEWPRAVALGIARPPATTRPMPAGAPPEEAANFDPFVRVPVLLSALRRQWRVVAATTLAGLLAALAFSWLSPPQARAAASVLLRHPSGTDPNRQVLTDVELFETRAVAQGASERLGGRPGADRMLAAYEAKGLSTELVQVTARAPSSREAVRRAQALAGSFVAFRQDHFRAQSAAAADALGARREEINRDLEAVEGQLAALSGAQPTGQATRELGELQSRKAVLGSELAIITQQIAQINLDTESVIAATRIVDPAHALDQSPVLLLALNLAAGLVLGLAGGAGWVVLREVTAGRVRNRDEVGRLLGSPVAVSVGRVARRTRWSQRLHLKRGRRRRNLGQLARHLRSALDRAGAIDGRRALAVVSVDSDSAAAMAAAKVAEDLSRAGESVLVTDLTGRAVVPRLLGVPPEDVVPDRGRAGFPCVMLPASARRLRIEGGRRERDSGALRRRADTVLTVATLDPAVGAIGLGEWAAAAVVVVTAGRSTTTGLRAVGEMVRAAGLRLDSAVIVGADGSDETAGIAASSPAAVPPSSVWSRR